MCYEVSWKIEFCKLKVQEYPPASSGARSIVLCRSITKNQNGNQNKCIPIVTCTRPRAISHLIVKKQVTILPPSWNQPSSYITLVYPPNQRSATFPVYPPPCPPQPPWNHPPKLFSTTCRRGTWSRPTWSCYYFEVVILSWAKRVRAIGTEGQTPQSRPSRRDFIHDPETHPRVYPWVSPGAVRASDTLQAEKGSRDSVSFLLLARAHQPWAHDIWSKRELRTI